MGDFERDTRVEGGEGRYTAELSRDWEIWGPNGGYVAAVALRAAGAEAAIPRPAVFSCHYLRVARFAPVDLEVVALRRGRSSESFRVSMSQDGKPVLEAMVRTAAEGKGLEHDVARAPEASDPEALKNIEELVPKGTPRHAFWQNFDARPLDPRWVGPGERPASDPVWREWYRFIPRGVMDDPFADAGRLLLLVDTLGWPAACQPHPGQQYIAPSLDAVCWFHRDGRDSEWLLTEHLCPVGESGLLGTTGRVFGRDGRLLASGGAQLYCMPAPPPR